MFDDKVYIIGGGPSLTGFDFKLLKGKNTIAINMSAKHVPEPTYSITADSYIFGKLQDGYFRDIKTTWVLVTNPNHCSMRMNEQNQFVNRKSGKTYNLFAANMIIRNRDVEGIGFSFNDFRTGYNSGFCAFQLAVLLRYKRIYLLGIDLRDFKNHYYYHDEYGNKKISDGELEKYYKNFVTAIKTVKEKTDIEIYSCSGLSRLNEFILYKPVEIAINE